MLLLLEKVKPELRAVPEPAPLSSRERLERERREQGRQLGVTHAATRRRLAQLVVRRR